MRDSVHREMKSVAISSRTMDLRGHIFVLSPWYADGLRIHFICTGFKLFVNKNCNFPAEDIEDYQPHPRLLSEVERSVRNGKSNFLQINGLR